MRALEHIALRIILKCAPFQDIHYILEDILVLNFGYSELLSYDYGSESGTLQNVS